MNTTKKEIKQYYDSLSGEKLNDYIYGNPRITEAWKTIIKDAPRNVSNVLEIGCGVGQTINRLSKKWPEAKFTGLDISGESIRIAQILFGGKNISFVEGILQPEIITEKYDLILMVDVYEHIEKQDRAEFHKNLKNILADKGRIIFNIPTPRLLHYLTKYEPSRVQPVDEAIDNEVINSLINQTGTEMIFYNEKKIFRYGDYVHLVIGRPQENWNYLARNSFVKKLTNRIKMYFLLPFRNLKKWYLLRKIRTLK
jgi:SAM-dependent methyltransferase